MTLLRLVILSFMIGAFGVTSAVAQVSDDYKSLSRELVRDGNEALAMEDAEAAKDLFERALVANPASVTALIGLGKSFEAMDSVPKGLKFYRHALAIEPNNLDALEAQSLAFLKRGLYDEAELNRDKLKRLCRAGCPALTDVEEALTAYLSQQADASAAQEGESNEP